MKQQVLWAHKGQNISNETASLVSAYFAKETLSKLGYQFNLEDLECWEAEAYGIIASELARLDSEEIKRGSRR